jgi:hypothetical protein
LDKNISLSPVELAYRELANAIVLQAVRDYRDALKRLERSPYSRTLLRDKREVERFFRSDWFATLTEIDPVMLMERLKSEVAG